MVEDRWQRTDDRRHRSDDGCQITEDGGQKTEDNEVGPVVVPNEWDYAAASMRKLEKGCGSKLEW